MDSETIVLKNIRRDIPALKPLAAKVICLQKDLIEAVKRYQELNSKPVRDEDAVQQLLNEILLIDQSQREQLNLVRETEKNYSSQVDIQEDALYCTENLSSDSSPIKSEIEKESSEDLVVDFRITGNEIKPKPVGTPSPSNESVLEPTPEENEENFEEEQGVMDWEDLTREQWSESDKLLQKVERVGSKVTQNDFLSTLDLVHVSQQNHAEDCMNRRKLLISQGKRVTTGPWQIFDVPTKVTNRRCNYLASGLHVTVRQKDPQRTIALASNEGGMKTRHQDSRGSSRTSSRASSPISTQTDSYSREHLSHPGKSRTMTTRASKVKRVGKPTANNPAAPTSASSKSANVSASATSPKSDAAEGKANGSLEPCVTYTLVDGFPHFKVFFPSSKDSTDTTVTTTTTTSSNRSGNLPAGKDSVHAPVSIVESGIEIIRPVSTFTSQSSHPKPATTYSTTDFSLNLAERNAKLKMAKSMKRPRLAQGYVSSSSGKSASVVETTITPIDNPDGNSATIAIKREDDNEEVGLCLEKCGSWMGAPHFKIYRTFPSVNSTSADWTSPVSSPTSTSSSTAAVPPNKTTLPMAPKLSTSLSTPRLSAAPIKSSGTNVKPTAVVTLPKMPKLTMGNAVPRNNLQQSLTLKPPSTTGVTTSTSTTTASSKPLVPIAPKLTPAIQTGALSNFVLVPFADKNQQGSVQANQQSRSALKRPISLLKTCSTLSKAPTSATTGTGGGGGGQLLTVKNLKECLQNSLNYKDMKVVVQKVPMPNGAAAVPSPTGQKFPAQPGTEDVKKKEVKSFPPPVHHKIHHHHRRSSDKESALDDSQTNIGPTVIVADMSA